MTVITNKIESQTFEAGKVVKVHGVNGRLVIRLLRQAAEVVDFPEWLFIRIDGGLVPYRVVEESVFQKDSGHLVVGLETIEGPEKAAEFVGLSCHIEGQWSDWFDAGEADPDSLVGFEVFDETSGKSGVVSGFEDIPGNPLLSILIDGKSALLPMHAEFILATDHKKRRLNLRIPDGLLDL